MKEKTFKKITKEYLSGFTVIAALFFMICIFEPLNIYFQNKIDYSCDFYLLFPECLGMFIIFTLAASALLFILERFAKHMYVYVVCLLLWGYISLYIQGNFMISALPLLDGSNIKWENYTGQMISSTIMWCFVLVVCFISLKLMKREKFFAFAKYTGVFVSLILLVTVVTLGVSKGGFDRKLELASTSKNMLDYSSDTNFILLVMDSMDSQVENQILDKYPEYEEALSDFTYYDNVSPGYICTLFALPHLYGGEMYEGEEDFEAYRDRTYMDSDFVNELKSRNFRLQGFTSEMPLNSEEITLYENVIDYKAKVDNHVEFCKVLLRMVGFKYAPYVIKSYTQVRPGELEEHLKKPENIRVINFDDTNVPFYKECLDYDFNISQEKCFKLIHLSAAHYPFEYTKDVELVTYSSYEDNMACSNTIIETYLNKLKDEGIYDNSIIFITADHGVGEDNDDYRRINPVLFVKGIGERHDRMQVNSAPISHDDFKSAYFRLLDGSDSARIFDWNEGDKRERRILFGHSLDSPLTEYIQTGEASDLTTLRESGITYRPYEYTK